MSQKQLTLRPMYTEKMSGLQETQNKYFFRVSIDANKIEIKKNIEQKFDVKVKSVNTMNVKGKMRQQMTKAGRFQGRRSGWKKAVVTLESGHSLELFGNA
jgi:large subunit ribosomal protein L23